MTSAKTTPPAHIAAADQRHAAAAALLANLVAVQRKRLGEFPEFAADSISACAMATAIKRTFPTPEALADALAVAIQRLANRD